MRVPRRGISEAPPEGDVGQIRGGAGVSPNQIHINIHNDLNKTLVDEIRPLFEDFFKKQSASNQSPRQNFVESILEKYGEPEVGEAIKIAIQRGKNGDIRYLEGILRNRNIKTAKSIENKSMLPERILIKINQAFPSLVKELKFLYRHEETFYFLHSDPRSCNFLEKELNKLLDGEKIVIRPMENNNSEAV